MTLFAFIGSLFEKKKIFETLFSANELKIKSLANLMETKEILDLELNTIARIKKDDEFKEKKLLMELSRYFSNHYETDVLLQLMSLNSSQEKILYESLDTDIRKIAFDVDYLHKILMSEKDLILNNNIALEMKQSRLKELFDKENKALSDLKLTLSQESELFKKLSAHLVTVKKLKHSEFVMNLTKGLAKTFIYKDFKIIIENQEQILRSGPVILAPRHFYGDYDPSLLYAIANRRLFFLGSIENYTANKIQRIENHIQFQKQGVIPVIRTESPEFDGDFKTADKINNEAFGSMLNHLQLNQAIVIFPEGWPNIDRNPTIKKGDEIIDVKHGIFHIVRFAQQKFNMRIPIIPIGTKYDLEAKPLKIINVKVGEPFYVPDNATKKDYEIYAKELKKIIIELSK